MLVSDISRKGEKRTVKGVLILVLVDVGLGLRQWLLQEVIKES